MMVGAARSNLHLTFFGLISPLICSCSLLNPTRVTVLPFVEQKDTTGYTNPNEARSKTFYRKDQVE